MRRVPCCGVSQARFEHGSRRAGFLAQKSAGLLASFDRIWKPSSVQDAYRSRTMNTNAAVLETFRTADYGQVGYLFARGFSFDRLEGDGGQIFFHFAPSPELLSALGEYGSN